MSFSATLWYVAIRENRDGILTISFLNIGQGDAILIESPTGMQVVIDGGPNKAIMKEITSIMPWYDRHIDMIMVTNPDKDHYEGFIPLFGRYTIGVEIEPGTVSQTEMFRTLKNIIQTKKVATIVARRGQIIDIGGGAYIQILFPDRDVSGLSTNNGSIVAKLVYGQTSVLLTGDSPTAIEEYLISQDKTILDSDILKVGHHGSRTSTSDAYVQAISPAYAMISAGKDNSYGHPHKEVLDILAKEKVPVLGTYDLGRITFVSDGRSFVRK